MYDLPEIECTECYWQGDVSELLCHPDDENKNADESRYVVCPECGAIDSYMDYED